MATGNQNTYEPTVEVRYIDDKKGKGLFALKDFKEGEILFKEQPLVCAQFLWNALYGYLACDFCMRPLETAEENAKRLAANSSLVLPYEDCCETNKNVHAHCPHCEIKYCSLSCKTQAWNQYHQVLCLGSVENYHSHPLVKLQETWRNVHYPPETASIMLIARMVACVKQATDKDGAKHLFSQFCHSTKNDEIAHKLLGEKFQDQLEELRRLFEAALFEDELINWFTPEGFRSLIALVGTNGQGIGTSSLSCWVKNCDSLEIDAPQRETLDKFIDKMYDDINKESGIFINNEASGLYPLQSSCNHSCIPNVEATFPENNFRLVMEAKRDITCGEEICVSYLDECNLSRSRHSRIKTLQENYLFTCNCQLCLEQVNDPDETSEEESDDDMDSD